MLIIIYFTLYVIQIVRKVPLQYVSYISINIVSENIPLKITVSGVLPILFSEAIILLTNNLFTHLSNERVFGIWYHCICVILIIVITFFYRYIAFPRNINKFGYDFS